MDSNFNGDNGSSAANDDFDIDIRLGGEEETGESITKFPVTRISCNGSTCSHTSPKLCC